MPTVINNPVPVERNNNGLWFLLTALVLIIFAILFFVYGLPYVSNTIRGPQINIPERVDVNIQNSQN